MGQCGELHYRLSASVAREGFGGRVLSADDRKLIALWTRFKRQAHAGKSGFDR